MCAQRIVTRLKWGIITAVIGVVILTAKAASAQAPEVDVANEPIPVFRDVLVNPYSMPDLSAQQNVSVKATGKVREYSLTIEQIRWNIVGDVYMTQWAFNGQVPGPLLEATEGDLVRISVKNNTAVDHTLHAHGLWSPVVMDGVPNVTQKPIGPGETFVYEFIAKPAGFHWYHCHVNAAEHLEMGLYGPFVVHPAPKTGLGTTKEQAVDPALKIDREYLLVIDEMDTRIDDGESGGRPPNNAVFRSDQRAKRPERGQPSRPRSGLGVRHGLLPGGPPPAPLDLPGRRPAKKLLRDGPAAEPIFSAQCCPTRS